MDVAAGAIYEAVVDFGVAGLVGTIGLTILDNEGGVAVARYTDNIMEISPGVYSRVGNIAPGVPGQYSLRWDDGSLGVGHTALEDLNVSAGIVGPYPIAATAITDVCALWAAPSDVVDCCADLASSDETRLDWALAQASDLLYHLTGHKYPGICEATVRPCTSYVSCWRPVMDSWVARDCSCVRLSKIRLAGYPVQAIVSVLIDDVVLDASEYRLDRQRELIRKADANGNPQTWPACQRLDLDSGAGTFFVTYTHGSNPPVAGSAAAAQLACEIAKQCPGSGVNDADCELPKGTVRITRQGLTVETQALGMWLLGSLRTGMPLVDAFLSVYGEAPRHKRVALAVPEADPWPLRVE